MIPVSRKRLLVLYVVLAALLLGLGARAWFLQVVNHRAYVAQANLDRIRDIVEPTVRGEITDDTGAPLVSNRSALVISVNMSLLGQQSDGGAAELRKLAALLHISDKTLTEKVRICTATVSQPCWPGSPVPAHPGGRARLGPDRRPGAGGQARLPRRDRPGPAGDPVRPADGHRRGPDPGLPPAHHRP